jgi:hypothetical protein
MKSTLRMRLLVTLLFASLLKANPSFAQVAETELTESTRTNVNVESPQLPYPPVSASPSQGIPTIRYSRGMFISGIVTTSIGGFFTLASLAILLGQNNGANNCSGEPDNNQTNCHVMADGLRNVAYGGIGLGLVGMAVGVPLIVVGGRSVPARVALVVSPQAFAIRGSW